MKLLLGTAPALALILLASTVGGALVLQQSVAVTPASATPPALLQAGPDGSTTLGSSATSASTTLASTIIVGTFNSDVLEIVPGAVDVNVTVSLIGETAVLGESLTLELDDGLISVPQIDVTNGAVVDAVGTPVELLSSDDPLTIHVSGVESLVSDDTVYTMEIRLTSPSGGDTVAVYSYVLTVT